MRQPTLTDYIFLTVLALIWASAFFNIKIATYSYGPVTIAFLRIFLGAIPVVALCFFKKIKIEAFSKDWYWFAAIGIINLVIPFFLIAYGVQKVQSNLAAILMASTPLSATILALFSALLILGGSTFYVIGGLLTLKVSNKKNENVTASILIWATIFLMPITAYVEQPWNLNPRLDSTISLVYLGVFSTGIAWLMRFRILKNNGLVFQAQVAYLIPIFGIVLGYIFLNEIITSKVIVAVAAVVLGIYFVRRSIKKKIT